MIITGLRIAGFKSFVDAVEAPIEAGLTGVVGPNGCGKSNVLEAVRWAMGATSARALRADDMDSVIFSGSSARPARESAEVVLVLQSASGEAIEVSRRIRREQGSSYRINGREARAKDVQILFADASTGANSPALVRQGQVSELIAAKPENRRRLLEEAAGVAGLHARRHEADLKLTAALANLERLDEIRAEIDALGQSLRRQARQAAKIKALALEMRKLEALVHVRRLDDAGAAIAARDSEHTRAHLLEADAAAAESEAQRASEAAELALAPAREEEAIAGAVARQAEAALALLARDLDAVQAEIDRLETNAARLNQDATRERQRLADADANLKRLTAEHAALSAQADEAECARLRHTAETQRAAAEAAETAWRAAAGAFMEAQARHDGAQRALNETGARSADLHARALAARDACAALAQARPDFTALETAAEAAEAALFAAQATHADAQDGFERADAALAAAKAAARAHSAQAQQLKTDLAALEAALAAQADALWDAVDADAGFEAAAAAALALDDGAVWQAAGARAGPVWPPGVAALGAHVRAPAEMAVRLAFTGIIDEAVDGAALIDALPDGARLVTRSGALWDWDGRTRTAVLDAGALRLQRRNQAQALRAQLGPLEHALALAEHHCSACAQACADADAERRTAAAALAQARTHAQTAQAALAHARASAAKAEAALAAKQIESASLDAQAKDADQALQRAKARAAEAPPADPKAQDAAKAAADQARAEAAQAASSAALSARADAARRARLDAIGEEQKAWRHRADEAVSRLGVLDQETAANADALATARARPAAFETDRQRLRAAHDQAVARLTRARENVNAVDRNVREASGALREAQLRAQSTREARIAAVAHLEAARARLNDLETAAQTALGLSREALQSLAGQVDAAMAKAALGDIERRLDRMRAERDANGPVNLRAEEELGEVEERLAHLARERADVASAVAKLRAGVARINSEARTRLHSAFETINAHFATLFATLFEGGEARLALTENDDPLACGLEIYACPPGKRLTALSLMSGGEQALTAAALIFAVFLASPAPLCVLDEVDAPLDDANVDRFCRMLERMRDMTQTRFLVITHNPITMARMDRLFGVTMAEAGVSQIVSVDLSVAKSMAA